MLSATFILLAYLIGSVPFAVVSSKAFGLPDPRSYGSGNPGATNVLRTGRKGAAALTLLGDAAKGWVAVALAQHFALGEPGIAAVAVAVFLGHLYPLFLGFKGGKGVATALGVLLALSGWLGLLVLLTWVAVAALWRYSSLAGIVAAVLAPLYSAWLLGAGWLFGGVLLMAVMLVWRHRGNLRKLAAGTEPRIGSGGARGASAEG
jgi:glycerol-3-phosphate acyltransferase PlsY